MIHKFLNRKKDYVDIPAEEREAIIEKSSKQVSRGVFYSTIIIITSFLPVFLLTGQEGKLFHPRQGRMDYHHQQKLGSAPGR